MPNLNVPPEVWRELSETAERAGRGAEEFAQEALALASKRADMISFVDAASLDEGRGRSWRVRQSVHAWVKRWNAARCDDPARRIFVESGKVCRGDLLRALGESEPYEGKRG